MKVCVLLITILFGCTASNRNNETGFVINDSNKNLLANISINSSSIEIASAQNTLKGIMKKEKRKYYNNTQAMMYAVKFSEDGFKLRDHSEQLLWKVKFYPDKLKISNNEEMMNAFEIKLRDGARLKLERNESVLKELMLVEGSDFVSIEQYSVSGIGVSLANGILLLNEINNQEKFVLMAEIKAQRR